MSAPQCRQRTQPKQAGSARSLDRWQREVKGLLRFLAHTHRPRFSGGCGDCMLIVRLRRLLRSMERAERR